MGTILLQSQRKELKKHQDESISSEKLVHSLSPPFLFLANETITIDIYASGIHEADRTTWDYSSFFKKIYLED
jgi:hypothetical protein